MRAARLTIFVALLLVVPVVSGAFAKGPSAPAGPKGLKGFLLRPNESVTHTFPRTPAFAWRPVKGAACYEFQLATSRTFDGNSVVWSNVSGGTNAARSCAGAKLSIPAISLNLTLPWFTGKPYALYAHVRAITTRGATKWSAPFGFNMRWEELPVPQTTRPGLVRWRPVDGATSYQVWYTDIGKTISTHTNVADLRELYLFHDDPNWWSTANWRVRAVRHVLGTIPNGLPAVSYGPWSPTYATTNPALTSGKLQLRAAVSDVMSLTWKGSPHQLMPALTFTGNQDLKGSAWPLFRVYAFTDSDCVNVVFRSSVVGGAAFAPRTSGPLELPTGTEEYDLALIGVLKSGKDEKAKTYSADGLEFKSNEALSGDTDAAAGSGTASATGSSDQATPQVRVDLPDVDSTTTRYFWTVVPVGIRVNDSGTYEYVDIDLPQDACEAGRVSTFAKLSKPAITASRTPYVSGLTPNGRLLTIAGARPTVYSTPLVAWEPVVGATSYEIQWSRTTYPWRASGTRRTLSTSTLLPLKPGLWYYRVRGLNAAQVGTQAMTWSAPAAIRVVRPTFRVTG
jgi:hypothetical protein